MGCIGVLNEGYRQRMYALLELYARPMARAESVICIDERSTKRIGHSREPLPTATGKPTKLDYEYVRNGTTNLFVAVEPKAGQRIDDREVLRSEVQAWQQARNAGNRTIEWNFTRQGVDRNLGRHYVSKFTC